MFNLRNVQPLSLSLYIYMHTVMHLKSSYEQLYVYITFLSPKHFRVSSMPGNPMLKSVHNKGPVSQLCIKFRLKVSY